MQVECVDSQTTEARFYIKLHTQISPHLLTAVARELKQLLLMITICRGNYKHRPIIVGGGWANAGAVGVLENWIMIIIVILYMILY